jgi:predicted AAA+ superfamily ATPase
MNTIIQRKLEEVIKNYLFKNKAILLFGARQTGKTTLIKELLKSYSQDSLFLNGDDYDIRELLAKPNATQLKPIVGKAKILVIDEAQQIQDIGMVLKIIYDNFKDVQLIATGSSSFEIANSVNEPLTGRKLVFNLYPFSFEEMSNHHGYLEEKRLLNHRLIYGNYPDIVCHPDMENKFIKELASSYLYKDILRLGGISKPVLLENILKALALQLGSEVKYNELAQTLGSDKNTIEKYIDLLEKSFIIFKLPGYNKNVRNEIKKGKKFYFYDNGIRNAIINDFNPSPARQDMGALWENFVISERKKYLNNRDLDRKMYFWRTTQQQEIDLIEENGDMLNAWEIKYNPKKKATLPKTFIKAYPKHNFAIIHPDNLNEFIMD